jgi:hypothetical protein
VRCLRHRLAKVVTGTLAGEQVGDHLDRVGAVAVMTRPAREPGLSHGPPLLHGHGDGARGAGIPASPARRFRDAPAAASYQRECPGRRMPTGLVESS